MISLLPLNLEDLLHGRAVESVRVEFKASWHPETTGYQTLKTICAFANDHQNLNGGYVVLGVAERDGAAVLPPAGLSPEQIASAGKWIRGQCRRIDPAYQPVIAPEVVGDRHILVLWAPASQVRPHQAPDGPRRPKRFWIRLGSETVDAAASGLLPALMAQTARVPWDDRPAPDARITDLDPDLIRSFLRQAGSRLAEAKSVEDIARRMRLTIRTNGCEVPRNVGLLCFSRDPSEWFRGALIETAHYVDGRSGDRIVERTFRGGLLGQFARCDRFVEGLTTTLVNRSGDRSLADRTLSYPRRAFRETLANALYHRSYDVGVPEPTKVHLHRDRVEVISYPGPVPGVEAEHFLPGAEPIPVPARNRRIGEILKEADMAEARLTGVNRIFESMELNGSPLPRFEFDEARTYFRVTLPMHPEHVGL